MTDEQARDRFEEMAENLLMIINGIELADPVDVLAKALRKAEERGRREEAARVAENWRHELQRIDAGKYIAEEIRKLKECTD